MGDERRQQRTVGDKGGQDLVKADRQSNTGSGETLWEEGGTRPGEGGRSNKKEDKAGRMERRRSKGKQRVIRLIKPRKADTPSNTKPDTFRKH